VTRDWTLSHPSILKVWDYQKDQIGSFPVRGTGPFALLSNAIPLQLVQNEKSRMAYAVWDLARSEPWRELVVPALSGPEPRGPDRRSCRTISPDGSLVAVAHPYSGNEGLMCVWETGSGRQVLRADLRYAWANNMLAFTP